MTKSIRIVVVDDHAIIREGLQMLLESEPDLEIVGQAANCAEALALTANQQPDILILDLDLGNESGLSFLSQLISVSEKTRILIFTGIQDVELHRHAIRLGALGIVQKSQASKTLIKAIRKVHDGEVWLDRILTATVLSEISQRNERKKDDPETPKIATLTEREREVIALIGESLKTNDIANRLFISEKTVRNHLASIYSKLGVADRFDLAIYAYKHKLAHPPQ
jgi:DNA-binding NarL/FixJ family response regulator